MIKGDVKISEPAMSLPPIQLRKDLESNFSTEESKIEVSGVERAADKLDAKIRFARLKRRMRTRSSSIF